MDRYVPCPRWQFLEIRRRPASTGIKQNIKPRVRILPLVLTVSLWVTGCSSSTAPIDRSGATDVPSGTVTVVIDMGDQTIEREIEAVPAGTTVAQVMAEITDPPVEMTGSGSMTFVNSIGELGIAGGKGWTFSVDGQRANQGVGSYVLSPPARVEWTHSSQRQPAAETAPGPAASGVEPAEVADEPAEHATGGP